MQKTLPQTLTTGCEFDTDIVAELKTSPADYFSAAFSLPKWLVEDWLDEYGLEVAWRICFASNRRPSIYIRTNTIKITTQQLAEKLRNADIDVDIVSDMQMLKIKSPKAVTDLPGFSDGEFSVQDITAARPVHILKPLPGWKILDLCAAPGTKTMQLAELTGDKAEIIATDIDAKRLEMVKENIARLGMKSIKIVEYEHLLDDSQFDAVLIDVPCSNTGVLAKRIEVRYRITPDAVAELTETQARLLKTAASTITPKGKICYSTCSIQKQENNQIVKEFLKKNPEFDLESEKLTLPSAESRDCDGGYTAILTRK